MNTAIKAGLGFVVMVLVLGAVAVMSVIGTYNSCINQEAGLEAQYKQNQNNYDNFYKKVIEASGVSDKYAEKLKVMYDSAIDERYGDNGSTALFQMITEQNPQLDVSVYKQMQELIDSGRESFKADQKALLDKKRVYEAYLGQIPSGPIAKMMGFPKKDISKFDIVSSDRTERAFETKKDDPIDLNPKPQTN